MTPILPSERDLYMVPLPELRTLLDRTAAVMYERIDAEGTAANQPLLGVLLEVLESAELPGRDWMNTFPSRSRPRRGRP